MGVRNARAPRAVAREGPGERAVSNGGGRHLMLPLDVQIEWVCYERANRRANHAYTTEGPAGGAGPSWRWAPSL